MAAETELTSLSKGKPVTFGPAGPDGRRPDRIDELLVELGEYWRRHPDLRLGQIVENFASALASATGADSTAVAYYSLEDDALLGMLKTSLSDPRVAARAYLGSADLSPRRWR